MMQLIVLLADASKAYFNKFNIKLTAFEAMPSGGTTIKQT